MKKLALVLTALLASGVAHGQSYPSPTFQTYTLKTLPTWPGQQVGLWGSNTAFANPSWLTPAQVQAMMPVLSVAGGGTGTATPSLVAGTNITVTGSWPNQTISWSGLNYLPLSGGTLTGTLFINSPTGVRIQDPSQPADQKFWDIYTQSSELIFRTVNDAYSAANPWMIITRSGYVPTVNFPASVVFSGSTLVPTMAAGDSSSNAASTAFVQNNIPKLTAGTNITITGTAPNYTIAASGSSGASSAVTAYSGLKITASGTTVAITANSLMLVNSSHAGQYVSAPSLSCATGTSGANGVDTGTIAANTWYAVYAISNGSTTACLLSASFTSPTLPGGYTYSMRVGAVRYGASALVATTQAGATVHYGAATILLPGASAGSISAPTWVAQSVTGVVPPSAGTIQLALACAGFYAAMVAQNTSYGAYNSITNPPPLESASAGVTHASFVLESTNIYYASNYTNWSLTAIGWTDNL
ncbi:MAG: hypothetical protein KGQ37_09415 [Hyphomicrobiales bacterium]|nr:hypothetical protein [Hyphomicrobiales bacterium]